LSTHILEIPADDDIDGGAMYAEVMVIDEGGIDLKVDGETIISASFDKIDPFQLAYSVLPESYILPDDVSRSDWEGTLQALTDDEGWNDEDLEYTMRLFLTALARRNGYEKK
jgi:hypothetical protein